MVAQYFTYRDIPTANRGLQGPDDILRNCFKGLDFFFKLAMANRPDDSRRLGMIEAKSKEHIEVILSMLLAYGIKKKTPLQAQKFYEYATGKKIEIKNKKLFFEPPKLEEELNYE